VRAGVTSGRDVSLHVQRCFNHTLTEIQIYQNDISYALEFIVRDLDIALWILYISV
jgi:hypothetical protein